MTTTTIPQDVPTPAGASPDTWQNHVPYRVLLGELRGIDGVDIDRVSVQPTAIQFSDGRIDDGSVHEAPHVYLGDDGITSSRPADSPRCSSSQPTRLIGGRSGMTRGGLGRSAVTTCADSTQRLWVHEGIQVVRREGSIQMVRQEGSRWDVGTKDNAISLERFDDSNQRVSEDVLEVGEARELAALLTKHADKLDVVRWGRLERPG